MGYIHWQVGGGSFISVYCLRNFLAGLVYVLWEMLVQDCSQALKIRPNCTLLQ
ncbi:hypothetical protein LINPERHAP2_LOCUS36925 [Linum perenne]